MCYQYQCTVFNWDKCAVKSINLSEYSKYSIWVLKPPRYCKALADERVVDCCLSLSSPAISTSAISSTIVPSCVLGASKPLCKGKEITVKLCPQVRCDYDDTTRHRVFHDLCDCPKAPFTLEISFEINFEIYLN